MDDDIEDLLHELSQAFLNVGWEHIEQEVFEADDHTKINLLLDAGVDFMTKLMSAYRTINPQSDTEYKLEELIAELRGGCFHTPYKLDSYLN